MLGDHAIDILLNIFWIRNIDGCLIGLAMFVARILCHHFLDQVAIRSLDFGEVSSLRCHDRPPVTLDDIGEKDRFYDAFHQDPKVTANCLRQRVIIIDRKLLFQGQTSSRLRPSGWMGC